MADAVAGYARHRAEEDRWALGRFVVPLVRWEELLAALPSASGDTTWTLSVLGVPGDVEQVEHVMSSDDRVTIATVECKAGSVADVERCGGYERLDVGVFVEPTGDIPDLDDFLRAVRAIGAAAKVRTGGVTSDAFPTLDEVAGFMRACRRAGVPFKATAGLHHAVRGDYRLTYEADSGRGLMFGFLNVALAAAFTWKGASADVILAALDERDQGAFRFDDTGVSWLGERLTLDDLERSRRSFFAGFGSCSFREPMAELGRGRPEP
jgi:hypothetical protein